VLDARDAESADSHVVACRQALVSLDYNIADWCKAASHWFDLRFIQDTHGILRVMAKCVYLRRFVISDLSDSSNPNMATPVQLADIREPLLELHSWMSEAGVDLPPFEVVFTEALALAKSMREDVDSWYRSRSYIDVADSDPYSGSDPFISDADPAQVPTRRKKLHPGHEQREDGELAPTS